MQQTTFDLEKKLIAEGYDLVVGIDEAGRGPLAGPVVACATTVRNFQFQNPNDKSNPNDKTSNNSDFMANLNLIRDSKTLSEKQRESLYDFIFEHFHVGVGICDHQTIDRINILEATYLAMKKAIASLTRNTQHETRNKNKHHIILVDGNKIIPNLSMEQRAIIGGDSTIKSIAAASIVAKVTRDRIMKEMHEKYPEYDFLQHKGYGTRAHLDALRKFGPSEIHRKSFAPIKNSTGL